jgi:hypothetical protein
VEEAFGVVTGELETSLMMLPRLAFAPSLLSLSFLDFEDLLESLERESCSLYGQSAILHNFDESIDALTTRCLKPFILVCFPVTRPNIPSHESQVGKPLP